MMLFIIHSPLFCPRPTSAVTLSGGNAAPFTPTAVYRLALGENTPFDGSMGTKLKDLASAHPVRH